MIYSTTFAKMHSMKPHTIQNTVSHNTVYSTFHVKSAMIINTFIACFFLFYLILVEMETWDEIFKNKVIELFLYENICFFFNKYKDSVISKLHYYVKAVM